MFEQVRQLLAHQFEVERKPPSPWTPTSRTISRGFVSDVVELVMSIEDAFGITIEDEKAAELTPSVGSWITSRRTLEHMHKKAGSRCCLLFYFWKCNSD